MATVLEKLNDILDEKNEKIIPENIKAGVKIFDIEGNMSGMGNDVYDFTAGDNMVYPTPRSIYTVADTNLFVSGKGIGYMPDGQTKGLINQDSETAVIMDLETVRNSLGITADMIAKGNKILGLEGTAEAGGTIEEAGYIETPFGDIKNYALQKAGLIPTNILGVYISVSRLYTYKDDNDAIYYQMELDVYNDGTTYTSHMYGDRTITLYDAEGNQLYSDFSVENYIPNAGMKTGTGFQGDSYSTSVNPNIAKATRLVWEFDLSTIKDVSM